MRSWPENIRNLVVRAVFYADGRIKSRATPLHYRGVCCRQDSRLKTHKAVMIDRSGYERCENDKYVPRSTTEAGMSSTGTDKIDGRE